MLFAYPWLLLLLVIPIFLLIGQWRLKGRAIPLPFDHSGAPRRLTRKR